jgi:hypothetical protein
MPMTNEIKEQSNKKKRSKMSSICIIPWLNQENKPHESFLWKRKKVAPKPH